MITQEERQSKINEFSDLLNQRNNAVQKKGLGLTLSEYEQYLIDAPYKDWLIISTLLADNEIDEEIYEDFLAYPTHYKAVNGAIIFNSNWEAEQKADRQQKAHITKLDFFTYLCVPAEISYAALEAKILELGMEAQWNLCNHVYFGVIKPFLNALPLGKTEDEILEIFEAHTPEE